MREKRDEIIILRTTKAEKNRIYEKMLGMGIRSLSAYIRKMALDGYCLHLDLKELRRMAYLLQMCSNNLNQYAKCANESGQVYAADLEDLRIRLDELISIGKQTLAKLTELQQYPQLDAAGYIDLPLTFVLIKQKIFKVTQIIRHKLLWMKTRVKLFLC